VAKDDSRSAVPHELSEALKSSNLDEVVVRELLGWFGFERRLPAAVSAIRDALTELGVTTEPDFEFAYLDAPIAFIRTNVTADARAPEPEDVVGQIVTEPWSDPTYRIGKLPAANKQLTVVKPSASLVEAITLMLQFDFSQLPVMTNDRDVRGAITWQSIGSRVGLGNVPTTIADAVEPAAEVRSDDSLFETLSTIERFGYVLIRGQDKKITGIVTATDVGVQFRILTEPFILIGEIENYIRRLLAGRFTLAELKKSVDPSRNAERISRVSDLTFGEYIRLVEEPENWKRLNVNLDRSLIVRALEEIRRIRNDVMHFDPDGIGSKDLEELRRFVGLFQTLAKLGVIKREPE
jgi:CBS domain-containing protein